MCFVKVYIFKMFDINCLKSWKKWNSLYSLLQYLRVFPHSADSIVLKVCCWITMPGFLAPGGEEFNLGPEMRLDRSELLCNKVLLKCKGDRESFWHRHQKGVERVPRAFFKITNRYWISSKALRWSEVFII